MSDHREHIPMLEFIQLTRQTLAPEKEKELRGHIAGCAACQKEFGFWSELAATLGEEREAIPESWHQRAALTPRRLPRASEPAPAGWVKVFLGFDNFQLAGAGAVRGGKARRHCVYHLQAEGNRELNLEVMVERLSGSAESWSVVGQVIPAEGTRFFGGQLQLSRDGADAVVAAPDVTGEFSFVRSDAGPWQLRVQDSERSWGMVPVLMP